MHSVVKEWSMFMIKAFKIVNRYSLINDVYSKVV